MNIKSTPILWGEDAERFNEEADRNGKLPTPKIPEERLRKVRKMWEDCQNSVFPPKDQQKTMNDQFGHAYNGDESTTN